MTDLSIALRSTIEKRKFDKGYAAYRAGQARDSHDMNPGSPMIERFEAGWDQAAKEHYGLASSSILAANQRGVPAP